jgi:hypothetical protein
MGKEESIPIDSSKDMSKKTYRDSVELIGREMTHWVKFILTKGGVEFWRLSP